MFSGAQTSSLWDEWSRGLGRHYPSSSAFHSFLSCILLLTLFLAAHPSHHSHFPLSFVFGPQLCVIAGSGLFASSVLFVCAIPMCDCEAPFSAKVPHLSAASLFWSWPSFPEISHLPRLPTKLLSCIFVIVAKSLPYFPESLVSAWLSGQGFSSSGAEVLPCSCWSALEHPSPSGRFHHQQPDLSAACSCWTRLAPGRPIAMLHHPTYFTLLTLCPAHVARLSRVPVSQASAWPSKAGVWSQF